MYLHTPSPLEPSSAYSKSYIPQSMMVLSETSAYVTKSWGENTHIGVGARRAGAGWHDIRIRDFALCVAIPLSYSRP